MMVRGYSRRKLSPIIGVGVFYLIYALGTIGANLFWKFNSLVLLSWIFIFLYLISILFGTMLGVCFPISLPRFGRGLPISRTLPVILMTATLITIEIWSILLKHYGGIAAVLLSPLSLREGIGTNESIIPVWLSYSSSIAIPGYIISLVIFGATKKRKYILFAVAFFVLVALLDLTTMGRIGIIFCIFCTIGFMIHFRVKIFKLRLFILLIIFYGLYATPKLIRSGGEGFSGSWEMRPTDKVKTPESLQGLMIGYSYYFDPIYTLNEYIRDINFNKDLLWGQRNGMVFLNPIRRIQGKERINAIDPIVLIPHENNIYTIIHDILLDFGPVGVLLLPSFFGYCLAQVLGKGNGYSEALSIFGFAWLFETPIYNIFIFGTFVISLLFLILLIMFFSRENYDFK